MRERPGRPTTRRARRAADVARSAPSTPASPRSAACRSGRARPRTGASPTSPARSLIGPRPSATSSASSATSPAAELKPQYAAVPASSYLTAYPAGCHADRVVEPQHRRRRPPSPTWRCSSTAPSNSVRVYNFAGYVALPASTSRPSFSTTTTTRRPSGARRADLRRASRPRPGNNFVHPACPSHLWRNHHVHRRLAARRDYRVADLSLAPFGRKEIHLAEHEMPGLRALAQGVRPVQAARRAPASPARCT